MVYNDAIENAVDMSRWWSWSLGKPYQYGVFI